MNAGGANRNGFQILAGPSCTERLPQTLSRLQRSVENNWSRYGVQYPGTSAMVAFVMSEVPKRQLASPGGDGVEARFQDKPRAAVELIR